MKTTHLKLIATAVLAMLPLTFWGQDKAAVNPRGLYKMTKLKGRGNKEINAPFDQYKICDDRSTVTFAIHARSEQTLEFRFIINDPRVFNYTGTDPQGEDGRGAQIYQCDGQQFHLRWWSRTKNHRYFPENGWVDEKYELNRTSPHAKNILELLRNTVFTDNRHPFGGRWVMIGNTNSEDRAKEIMKNPEKNEKMLARMVIANNQILKLEYWNSIRAFAGNVYPCSAIGKKELHIDNRSYPTQWEGDDLFCYKNHKGTYEVWQRDNDRTPYYEFIISQLAQRHPQEKPMQQMEEMTDEALQPQVVQKYRETDPNARENPRGIYKLVALLDKYNIIIKEPYDQYKICTDSVTLTLNVNDQSFSLLSNDKTVLSFTGEDPDAEDAIATRVFDSNADHFTLKWWSTREGHVYFPHNSWCTEYYESCKYSANAKLILDALMSNNASDPKNPLIGTWRYIGMMDDLTHTKKDLKILRQKAEQQGNTFWLYTIFTPTHTIATNSITGTGVINTFESTGKKTFKTDGKEHTFTWLSKNYIAVEVELSGYRIDYQILERVTDSTPVLNKLASLFVTH